MKILKKILGKKKKLIVGLMSGTSADGIDAALVELTGSGTNTTIRQIAFCTYCYPAGFHSFLMKNSNPSTARLDDVARLDMLIAMMFADAAQNVVRTSGYSMRDIDLIGSHGQTIQHLPSNSRLFGKNIRATMQIGNPSVLAKLTGVVTVGDFRTGDVAVGGSGAPLVPYFDYIVLRSRSKDRAALNIGGIANITVIPKNCSPDEVIAFDTGPGNMIIDGLMRALFHQSYDAGGAVSSRGIILPGLLRQMMRHPYFRNKPPKSTGREMFGEEFVRKVLRHTRGKRSFDIITTATEFTAMTIYDQYLRFIRNKKRLDELFVSGGGALNPYLMNALQRYFDGVRVRTTEDVSIPSEAKESICFALLANETIHGRAANLPSATGAHRATVLGAICLP